MTIIDFPQGGRGGPASASSLAAHPTSRVLGRRRRRPTSSARTVDLRVPAGAPPTGEWLTTYEELAACCAEVVAAAPMRVYDAEWEELVDWIRSRLAVLDSLKQGGAS